MRKLRQEYDLIVVGAGPAGSTAARYAAENGVSVLLLEKDREIGTPVRCAEGISGRSLREFVTPDPRWIAREIKGARLVAPSGEFVDVMEQDLGYVLERRLFDRYLAQLAAAAGAEVVTNTEVTGLLFDRAGAVCGVEAQQHHRNLEIRGKIVIGADGVESRVGTWAGLSTLVKLKEMESCYQYLATKIDFNPDLCYFYVGHDFAPGGYAWLFPKGEGVANIGLGVNGKPNKRGTAKVVLDRFMEKHFPNAQILGETAGGVPVALFMETMVKDGLMLAGDAAHMVNTMTGGGIASGMFGGREAGIVAAAAIKEGNVSGNRLSEYHHRWEKVQGKKLRHYDRLSQAVSKMDDDTFNRTCAVLKKSGEKSLSLGQVFKTALMSDPKLLIDVTKVFFTRKFED